MNAARWMTILHMGGGTAGSAHSDREHNVVRRSIRAMLIVDVVFVVVLSTLLVHGQSLAPTYLWRVASRVGFDGLGTADRRLGNNRDAVNQFNKALDRNPGYFEEHYNLALTSARPREVSRGDGKLHQRRYGSSRMWLRS